MTRENVIYDLVIIGGGPAGTPVAIEYASIHPDKKIILIDEKGKLGGECLFGGCIPSKILEASGKHLKDLEKLSSFGIKLNGAHPALIWADVIRKKKKILSSRSVEASNKAKFFDNITIKKGTASFANKTCLILKTAQGKEKVFFKKAVIGTGSRTSVSEFKGSGIDKAWTNKELFDKMELPSSITIIGDGPEGIEFAQIFSRFKVKVNLIGISNNILPMIDPEFSKLLLNRIKNDNKISLILNANVTKIDFENKTFEVKYEQSNSKKTVKSSNVLIATGRIPNLENLKLENAKIRYNNKGIIVDKYMQTTNKNVYAAGDVVAGTPMFAHTASYEAHIISQNLFIGRNRIKTNLDKNSWVLFSDPNIVSAGISESQAKERGIDIITGTYRYSIDAKSQIDDEAFGYLKYIVDKKTLQIIGISIITANAQTISGEAALIVSNKLTLENLVNTIQPHPTLSESFTFLAKSMMGDIIKKRTNSPLFRIGIFLKRWI